MDYSIHDAIEAGFNKVVFIIRKDIEEEFKEVIGDRIESICSKHQVTVDYAFQDINEIPGELPEGRTKPWGTGQAVLAAKDMLTTPFIVINADDYYGKEGFRAVHEYLVRGGESCMAGFVLSYPAIESFTLSNFEHHVFEERKETGKELKQYLHSRHINHQNITEESLMCAVRELWEALQKIGKLNLDLDDFREVNKKIFDFEEKEMESNKAYRILSLLCVSLLDLGLLEIEEET